MTDQATAIMALTLHRPWAWAIAHSTKRIENRTWPAPARQIGKWIAIHAGKTFDREAIARLRANGIDCPEDESSHPLGIVAVARLARSIELASEDVPKEQEPWVAGPHCWLFDDVITLPEPVLCSGAQGLWAVTDGLLERVRHQCVLARKGARR